MDLICHLVLLSALVNVARASVMVLDSRGNVEMIDNEYDARYDSLRANALSVRGVWAVVTQVRGGGNNEIIWGPTAETACNLFLTLSYFHCHNDPLTNSHRVQNKYTSYN